MTEEFKNYNEDKGDAGSAGFGPAGTSGDFPRRTCICEECADMGCTCPGCIVLFPTHNDAALDGAPDALDADGNVSAERSVDAAAAADMASAERPVDNGVARDGLIVDESAAERPDAERSADNPGNPADVDEPDHNPEPSGLPENPERPESPDLPENPGNPPASPTLPAVITRFGEIVAVRVPDITFTSADIVKMEKAIASGAFDKDVVKAPPYESNLHAGLLGDGDGNDIVEINGVEDLTGAWGTPPGTWCVQRPGLCAVPRARRAMPDAWRAQPDVPPARPDVSNALGGWGAPPDMAGQASGWNPPLADCDARPDDWRAAPEGPSARREGRGTRPDRGVARRGERDDDMYERCALSDDCLEDDDDWEDDEQNDGNGVGVVYGPWHPGGAQIVGGALSDGDGPGDARPGDGRPNDSHDSRIVHPCFFGAADPALESDSAADASDVSDIHDALSTLDVLADIDDDDCDDADCADADADGADADYDPDHIVHTDRVDLNGCWKFPFEPRWDPARPRNAHPRDRRPRSACEYAGTFHDMGIVNSKNQNPADKSPSHAGITHTRLLEEAARRLAVCLERDGESSRTWPYCLWTALELMGIEKPRPAPRSEASRAYMDDSPLYMAVPNANVRPRQRHTMPGLRYVVAAFGPQTRTIGVGMLDDSVRCVDAVDTWIMFASHLSLEELVVLGDSMMRRGYLGVSCRLEEFERRVESLRAMGEERSAGGDWHKPHGLRACEKALRLMRERTDSSQETRLRLALMRCGLDEPQVNHMMENPRSGGRLYLDLAYPELKIAIEYDGMHHARQWLADSARRTAIEDAGWIYIQVTKDDLADLDAERELARRVAERMSRRVGHKVRLRAESTTEQLADRRRMSRRRRPMWEVDG